MEIKIYKYLKSTQLKSSDFMEICINYNLLEIFFVFMSVRLGAIGAITQVKTKILKHVHKLLYMLEEVKHGLLLAHREL